MSNNKLKLSRKMGKSKKKLNLSKKKLKLGLKKNPPVRETTNVRETMYVSLSRPGETQEQMGWRKASPKDTRCEEAVETGLRDRKGLSTSLSKQDKHGD